VVVLTREPCPDLAECLDSLRWAGELIAADDHSGEETLALLRSHGARILQQDHDLVRAHDGNFDVARNPAFDAATRSWILVVDADEVVTAELREEIERVVRKGEKLAFEIPRRNLYWGRSSRVLGADRQLRLYPRGGGRYLGNRLDCPPDVDHPVRRLSAPLVHRQRRLLHKLRMRTDARARRAVRAGEVPETAALTLFWHHLRWYALEQEAWRDGPRGMLLAAIYAAYPALEAAKARRLLRSEDER
jgi:glycosyltransferase involved in cell wall biosynthesis